MQGITRLFNSSARLSLLKNNASLVSAVYKTNSMHFPNFLKSDSPTYCCMLCVGYKSRRGRYSEEKFDWEIDHPFDDDSKVEMDTEVFTDEGRTRYHFMLKGFGVMCYIFFCNLGYFIRLRLNELKRGKPKTTSWRESVYWENKGFTGFMTLSYLLAITVPIVSFWICHRCVRSLWLLRGGKTVRVQTFSPFFLPNTYEVPIQNISGLNSRGGEKYVMFQLKKLNNKILPLTMSSMTGTFKEPLLYDSYIGQYRNLKAE